MEDDLGQRLGGLAGGARDVYVAVRFKDGEQLEWGFRFVAAVWQRAAIRAKRGVASGLH